MAVERPLKLDTDGELKQIIPNTSSAGAADAGKLVALSPDGKLDDSFLHESGSQMFTASENITAGQLVNIFDSGAGVVKVRKANANSGYPSHGFATENIALGDSGHVNVGEGVNSNLSTLTVGAKYFSDPATPGGIVTPAPTYTAGQICQYVGVAVSDTALAYVNERIVKIA